MAGYYITFMVFSITYGFTRSWIAAVSVAVLPLVFTLQYREGKKEKEKLASLSPEERKQQEENIQRKRDQVSAEEVCKHETKFRYGTAAAIIAQHYPQLCERYYSKRGEGIWCNDKKLADKVARIIKLEFRDGKYQVIDAVQTYERAKKICNSHVCCNC